MRHYVQHEQSQDEVIKALQRQVDELTSANLMLQDQLARKDQFVAMIAHELRSPLTPIIDLSLRCLIPPSLEIGITVVSSKPWVTCWTMPSNIPTKIPL